MNWFDIVVFLLLVLAVWDGWRHGLVAQVLGLVAIGLGVLLAWKYGSAIGGWFGLEGIAATVTGFVAVLVVVIVGVVLIGLLGRGLLKITGLGVFDSVLGVVFSMVKTFVIVGLVVMLVEAVDVHGKVISEAVKEHSVMYGVVEAVNGAIFPFVRELFR